MSFMSSTNIFGSPSTTTSTSATNLFGTPITVTSTGASNFFGSASANTPSLFGNIFQPQIASTPVITSTSAATPAVPFPSVTTAASGFPSFIRTSANATSFSFGGFPTATASTAAPTLNSFGLSSQTNTLFTTTQSQSLFATCGTPTTAVGLGGVLSSLSGAGEGGKILTPKDSPVPKEILELVNLMASEVKSNRLIFDEILNFDPSRLTEIEKKIEYVSADQVRLNRNTYELAKAARALRTQSRHDLRLAENAQRFRESAISYDHNAVMKYLHTLSETYELQVQSISDHLGYLENLMNGSVQHSRTPEAIVANIYKMNDTFKTLSVEFYRVHEDAKLVTKRRYTPVESLSNKSGKIYAYENIKGPSPFQPSTNAALVSSTTVLNRALMGRSSASVLSKTFEKEAKGEGSPRHSKSKRDFFGFSRREYF
ncbi:Nucleoporin p58/p45 [Trichinella pseudospiralis]|uniref:Nucleoporin p58/p45 n=1 Tax=Trichinella pseudospiralis TaxID=6337 RepID=A0A0V0YGP1_TRIPS|nr:Nucleoporin p58/p45 [Trichinella pseudospiralis]KRY77582.1 Nucleoporin p58/p45 [Trichinella pseudospiralis]KRY88345.1 Nucleoporin p58/p45 [Trichinella pseudospiralis]KRZ43864.1 Nucleoporin p58/p45 [Trichinella pseudospiralis]